MKIIPGGQTLGARIEGIDLGSLCRAAIFDRCCGLWGNGPLTYHYRLARRQ